MKKWIDRIKNDIKIDGGNEREVGDQDIWNCRTSGLNPSNWVR